jgi:fructokinase
LQFSPAWEAALQQAQAVCFGTLAQRNAVSRDTIQRCLQTVGDECLVVYDVNLRPPFFDAGVIAASIASANIVKLNDDEARTLQPLLGGPFGGDREFARWLLTTHNLDAVCITRGAQGATLITADQAFEAPGLPITVADTVGAGDAFTAGLIWGCLARWPWDRALHLANRAGALVASRLGAMPVLREEFRALQT